MHQNGNTNYEHRVLHDSLLATDKLSTNLRKHANTVQKN